MATKLSTPFEAWDFAEEETFRAMTFQDLQLQWIKTNLAKSMEEKASLSVDAGSSPEHYYRMQEYLRGQCEILKYLLSMHTIEMEKQIQVHNSNAIKNKEI